MHIINKFSMCELTKTLSFIINRQFPFFGPNFWSKREESKNQHKIQHKIRIFKLVSRHVLFQSHSFGFLDHIFPNWKFLVQKKTNEHTHQIQPFWIIQGNKFHFKKKKLLFCSKFLQERYFSSKTRQMNLTIEFKAFKFF